MTGRSSTMHTKMVLLVGNLCKDQNDQQDRSQEPNLTFFNPATLWRLIGYDTQPSSRLNQLKQDYVETLKQFYSHHLVFGLKL